MYYGSANWLKPTNKTAVNLLHRHILYHAAESKQGTG